MRLRRSLIHAFLAVLMVLLPLTALAIVPTAGAADPVLYTQADNPNLLGYAPSADYAAPADAFDSMTADDFVVPQDEKWQITQVDVSGSTLAANQPTSFNIFIYTNVSNDPGVQIFGATGLSYIQSSLLYSIAVPNGPTLPEGTYWLVVQANAASGQNWAWMNRTVQTGTRAQFQNPGGAVAASCTSGWSNRSGCVTGAGPDQIFVLYGLQLPNQPPVNTVPGPQTVIDNATITFNAANSNQISVADSDAGTNNLEVTLSVTHGTLTLATLAGLNFGCGGCNGDGDASTKFRGNLSEINAALNGLVYNPDDGYGGPDTLTIATNDLGNNGTGGAQSDTDTVAITVRARTALSAVSGMVDYGGGNATLKATLDTIAITDPATDLSGQTITFKIDGNVVATAPTNASGVATYTGPIALPGINAGTYANRLEAEFAGSTYLLPAADATGTLTVKRRIVFVRPIDRTVPLYGPNPPSTPPADCLASQTPTAACWLELVNGSSFAPGDDWGDLGVFRANNAGLRFTYSRNPAAPGFTEAVGKTYKIGATGLASPNYEVRYQIGTLTVVPAQP